MNKNIMVTKFNGHTSIKETHSDYPPNHDR